MEKVRKDEWDSADIEAGLRHPDWVTSANKLKPEKKKLFIIKMIKD